MGLLARALSGDEEDQLTCQECEARLPDFLLAEETGAAGEPGWRSIALHLETCPHCSGVYGTLLDLTALAFGERGVEPPSYPAPDLSFLAAETSEPGFWRLDELGHLVIEFSADLLRTLPPPPSPSAYATVRTKSGQSRGTSFQLSLKGEVDDLNVTITTEKSRKNEAYCNLIVEVDIPSRGGWPNLADTEVTIKRGESEPETNLTDAFGKAVFTGIATDELALLIFEINPGERET